MSLFRKPKKMQRRVFSSALDDDDEECVQQSKGEETARMPTPPPPPKISEKSKEKKEKIKSKSSKPDEGISTKKALLSFADDEDEGEVFQVRKSSNSKKIARLLDKERRKKRKEEREGLNFSSSIGIRERSGCNENSESRSVSANDNAHRNGRKTSSNNLGSTSSSNSGSKFNSNSASTSAAFPTTTTAKAEECKIKKSDKNQTEIHTDGFVLVVKQTEPNLILNGRAAVCAGRDDMSDEDEDDSTAYTNETSKSRNGSHRFSKPEQLKQMLESGSIPDAAMIHAARKRRQKAREQGDFIPVEEVKEQPCIGSRLPRDDVEGDNSDDEERVDMNGITGIKEREERREQFYSVENNSSGEDSDRETNEWENQQIRKGVTGAQLINAQHETVLSRFMIKSAAALEYEQGPVSTSTLLEQAYAKSSLEKPQKIISSTKAKPNIGKSAAIRTPQEIHDAIVTRLNKLKDMNDIHTAEIDRIEKELSTLKVEELDCKQKAPAAAAKYRFYQELKCYLTDLVDCLNEKNSLITDLEKRTLQMFSKHQCFLVERRRQDVRDQVKEVAEASKPPSANRRTVPENEEQIRRVAEREGRRTRRRYEREKNEKSGSHLDGMSSDNETSDRYQELLQTNLEQIQQEAEVIFSDVNDEFCKIDLILNKIYAWRKIDLESYNNAFVSLCLPKMLGPIIRLEMLTWSPLLEEYKDIENMNWFSACMLYAFEEDETEESLRASPDIYLVPTIVEKIVLPKLIEHVQQCWDPLSTTQTLRLIGFLNRLGREYPLKETSKTLQQLFEAVLAKMKLALENDVFIPIFPKQLQEAKTSFFQRQFCSGLKLFRNFLSWQGIIADKPLRDMAISSLLNRYLLMALRVCTKNDAIAKAYIVVNTLPTAWLAPASDTLKSLELFIAYIKKTVESNEETNIHFTHTTDKGRHILQRLHCTS